MSSRRAERLVNLVICLLATRQYLPASRIRQAVPGYEPDDGSVKADETFKRMFERDKAEQRVRRRGRVPDRPPRLRAAGDRAAARRGGRGRAGRPAVAVRPAGRGGE